MNEALSMTRTVPARTATARQALRDALADGPLTAHELSARAGVAEREVVGHLEHLERTAKARGESFVVEPSRCDECGFVFKKRDRLGRPSKCPVCRSNHVVPPRFSMPR
jgi:predicted Zn-ribbon and HTH transcriptional regulator